MTTQTATETAAAPKAFPTVFWTANLTELFERAAYYSMASFVVIYLGQLGFGSYWPSFLNSVVLWGVVYFLPILSGTVADQIGFRRGLLIAFVLLTAGYFLMGYPVWFGGSSLTQTIGTEVTASTRDALVIVAAILLIGFGGSIVKPCISGTVQKVSGTRATLGFAIFYMVINIGSLFGRGTAFVVRSGSGVGTVLMVVGVCTMAAAGLILLVRWTTQAHREKNPVWIPTLGFTLIVVAAGGTIAQVFQARAGERGVADPHQLSYIFAVAAAAAAVAFLVVLLSYREPARPADAPAKPKRTIGQIFMDMLLVLGSLRFALFLLVMAGFFFIYNQVYNVLPLYTKKVVETTPAMDLYTAANPFVIVCFQLLITRAFGKMRPIRSMVVGSVIVGIAMLINLAPIFMEGGIRAVALNWLPLASIFIILTVALIALGELFTSARMYEYIGALAPKGKEGLFLGYANLPLALGAMLGGPVGAILFNQVMAKGATTRPDGLLELDPQQNAIGWLILMAIGLVSAAALWQFNRWVVRPHSPGAPAAGTRRPAAVTIAAGGVLLLGALSLVTAVYGIAARPLTTGTVVAVVLQLGFAALDFAVGRTLLAGGGWARGLFIVAFPTLWGFLYLSFLLPFVVAVCGLVWAAGMVLLLTRPAIAYLGDD